jgi:flagellar biogenesis protein FliO
MVIFLTSIWLAWAGSALVSSVKIDGESEGVLHFHCTGCESPAMSIRDNVVDLKWPSTALDSSYHGKFEVSHPHPLISRVSVFESGADLKAVVLVKGTTENLSDRVRVKTVPDEIAISVAFANPNASALSLFQKAEDVPVNVGAQVVSAKTPGARSYALGVALGLLITALGTFAIVRWMKLKGKQGGTRRFLIEKMAYLPLEGKSGVCLLKIGTELVLIGITGQSVSFLSSLPRLQEEYDSESRLERRAFKDAVEEEFKRIQRAPIAA